LLIKRRAGDAFGESYTFPGGVLDEDESAACDLAHGITADQANTVLKIEKGGLDYYSAGIRELFEETGVLLARDNTGKWATQDSWSDGDRLRVDKGQLPWAEFLAQQGLIMAFDALNYFAYWETPLSMTSRWATRFFAAELPVGQSASHDGTETTDSRWLSASEAIQQRREGLIEMPYPTVKTLECLCNFSSIHELLDWARSEQDTGVQMIRPNFKQAPEVY
jgi:8-oxo-dGTP pyrophosphatase MutT (NUDIX family)